MARTPVRGYTRSDGTQVRAHTRGVGGGAAVAVAATVLAGYVLTGGALSGGAASGSSAAARPGVSAGTGAAAQRQLKVRTDRAVRGVLRVQRQGYRVTSRTSLDGADCAGHSYGTVRTFFRDRPCAGLARAVFEVRDRRRNVVLVAVSWVVMPDEAGAAAYRRLVDVDGTGNVTELSRERGRYRGVRFTGQPYASRRDDTSVVNVQAEPVGRSPGRAVLDSLVKAATA